MMWTSDYNNGYIYGEKSDLVPGWVKDERYMYCEPAFTNSSKKNHLLHSVFSMFTSILAR